MTQSYSHYVSSFGITINLKVHASSAFHKALKNEPFWHEFVPGFRYGKISSPVSTWHIFESELLDYDQLEQRIHSGVVNIKLIVVIIEAVFEQLRQRNAMYTLHGAIIIRHNKAVGLIGNMSGIGKTSLAAYAASNGWIWVADEKFTILHGHVIGSTQGILNDEKTRLSAGHILPVPLSGGYPLVLFCQPILTQELKVTEFIVSYQKALWILYDEVSRDIRQVNGIVDSELPVLQSFDAPKIAQQRMQAMHVLAGNTPVMYSRGPKKLLLEKIESMLRGYSRAL